MLFNWHGWPVVLILPEGGLVKESFTSNKLKGCCVPHMTSIVEVRMDLFIEKKHLSLSLDMCECDVKVYNELAIGMFTTYLLLKSNQNSIRCSDAFEALTSPWWFYPWYPTLRPSLIYDGFTSGMHGGVWNMSPKQIRSFCWKSSVSEKKTYCISIRFVVLPPWDNHITPIITMQWVNHFDNDLRLNSFIDIPKNVFTPNLSTIFFVSLSTFTSLAVTSPSILGLQESRKQRATSKKYTMIPILQEVTNFSSGKKKKRWSIMSTWPWPANKACECI